MASCPRGARLGAASLVSLLCLLTLLFVTFSASTAAAQRAPGGENAATAAGARATARLVGRARDAAGRPLGGALIRVLDARGRALASVRSNARGDFALAVQAGARRATITAAGFTPLATRLAQLPRRGEERIWNPRPRLSPLRQTVIVAATGAPTPEAQLGAAASVTAREQMEAQLPLTLVSALRLVPGLSLAKDGQVGAFTTPAMRGGPQQFVKLTYDGIPIQRFDFGSYNLSDLLPGAVEQVQIVRGPDSVIYGSDAAAGVIAVTTRQGGPGAAPEFDDETLAGPYATLEQSNELLGGWRGFDYALHFAHLGTNNNEPNSKFRALDYGGDIGLTPARGWRLRAQVLRVAGAGGAPNTFAFFGLADNSSWHQGETYQRYSLTQSTARWSQEFSVGQSETAYEFDTPGPVGVLTNTAFGPAYLGLPVTITGANGYSVSGQAYLDDTGPYPVNTTIETTRRDADWRGEYAFSPAWRWVGGYRYYDEYGGGSTQENLSRHDHGVFSQLSGGWGRRLYASAGVAEDWNTPFGRSFNPQAGAAWLARTGAGWLNETRLRASAGAALVDPSLYQEAASLYRALSDAGRQDLISSLHIAPAAPQRARSGDAGVDQFFAGDRLRASATVFDAHYYDLIEFVPVPGLLALGVPPAAANATIYGADFNSLAETAKGVETAAALRSGPMRLDATFTYQDARVTRSSSSDALEPSVNPLFPNLPIGAYAPLIGGRPFEVPPETFSARAAWLTARWTMETTFWWRSRADASTFLSDATFGPTLLLPNHDLNPAFSSLNLSGYYRLSPRWRLEAAVDNVLDNRAPEVIGYPGLGATGEMGIRFTWRAAR